MEHRIDRGDPILLAWSGGKDSAMALAALRGDSRCRVIGLVTTVTRDFDRVSIHGIRRSILHAQAAALGLPLIEAELAAHSSNDEYEEAWAAALRHAQTRLEAFDHVAYGDLFLEDIRRYRDDQLARLGVQAVYPLWGQPTPDLARRFIGGGYEAYLTCVDTSQLAAEFAGRRFDDALLADLPDGVDPCGERGEFHTCVVGGPPFARRLPVEPGDRILREGRFQYCDVVWTGGTDMASDAPERVLAPS